METSFRTLPRTERRYHLRVRRHLLRNYLAHSIEGGLYLGGIQFIAAETFGPVMVASLGGPVWLAALMPILQVVGFTAPQLLTVHRIERLERHKPLVATTGIFQRLPYLLAALVLIWFAGDYPLLALAALACCPLLSGLVGGISFTAWQELVAKTIPPNRRSSVWAVRNIIAAVIGLGAGAVIARVLTWAPGAPGYGILHLVALAFLGVSFLIFTLIRETPYPRIAVPPKRTLSDTFRRMPSLLRSDARLRRYIMNEMLMTGLYIMMPFLGIHALAVLEESPHFMGYLVAAQMIGGMVGNVLAGWAGDRYGGKVVMLLGRAGFLAVCVWMPLAQARWEFVGAFILFGWAWANRRVGTSTLVLEVVPSDRRAGALAFIATCALLASIPAWALSSHVWQWTGGRFAAVAALTGLCVLAASAFLLGVREPRQKEQGPGTGD